MPRSMNLPKWPCKGIGKPRRSFILRHIANCGGIPITYLENIMHPTSIVTILSRKPCSVAMKSFMLLRGKVSFVHGPADL